MLIGVNSFKPSDQFRELYDPYTLLCIALNHCGLVGDVCLSELGHGWVKLWLIAYSAPSLHLNQWSVCCSTNKGLIYKVISDDLVDLTFVSWATNFSEIWIKIKIFFLGKAFANVLIEWTLILFLLHLQAGKEKRESPIKTEMGLATSKLEYIKLFGRWKWQWWRVLLL